jgi:hypothetical protein
MRPATPVWIMVMAFLAAVAVAAVVAVVWLRRRRGEVRGFEVRPIESEDRGGE